MIYGQCKCGAIQFWGSGMNPAPCNPCKQCGTIPATHVNAHPEPIDHEFYVSQVETDEGMKPLSRCRYCMKTKAQIAKEEE